MDYRSIKKASILGIITMLSILGSIGIYEFDQLNKLNKIKASLRHTNDVLVALHSVFAKVEGAETGQRGFLLTGNETYLAPYNDAVLRVKDLLSQVRELTANNIEQSKDVATLEKTVNSKFAEMQRTIDLRRAKGFEAARNEVLTNRGRNQMALIRITFDQMYERENRLLTMREQEQDSRIKYSALCLFFFSGVAIIFQLVMGFITMNFLDREKLSNDTLREQAELLDLSRDGVLVRKIDGTIRYWNRGAERMYGFRKDEALGQISHTLLKTEFPLPMDEIEKKLLAEGYWEGELVRYASDGRRIIVASRKILKTDEQGESNEVLESNTDITEQKQAELRHLALAEMQRVNTELEQFAYVASHDLQEPLRAIAGCLQILEKSYKDKLGDDAAELIQYAVDGSLRMRTLINDLLSLSRVSSSDIKLERTDLKKVLEEAIKNIELTVKEKNAAITNDPLPVITAQPTLLVQLFQNLLSNAIKFCQDKTPEIHISAKKHGSQWQICVSDNGIGFEKGQADKIFQPFKRLHGTEKFPGSGIGLTICKRIVERQSGKIWAESEPGKGTSFYFTLTDFD